MLEASEVTRKLPARLRERFVTSRKLPAPLRERFVTSRKLPARLRERFVTSRKLVALLREGFGSIFITNYAIKIEKIWFLLRIS